MFLHRKEKRKLIQLREGVGGEEEMKEGTWGFLFFFFGRGK